MNYPVHYLEKQSEFDRAMENLRTATWIGFDTEFVGEKSYIPVLCLLQIVSENDIFLVDTLRITELDSFLQLLSDPNILKITHAGDNDYRLLNTLFGTVPQNTFDTQISAGFVGYNYPAGFGKIVERELGITLAKSHTVANWEARPLDPKAVEYAIEDVKYLPTLHHRLSNKLQKRSREEWAREENRKWESAEFYEVDPYKEVLSSDFIHQLDYRDKLFLMRIFRWRREKAADLNVPKDAVLQSKHITSVVKAMRHGQQSFKANRTLPENVWRRHLQDWEELRKQPANDVEKNFLNNLPAPAPDDPEEDWSMELMYHFVKKQCLDHEISAALLLPRGDFNKIKSGEPHDPDMLRGWRAKLLGPQLVEWLKSRATLNIVWQNNDCIIQMPT